jgi:hypothetical protein
VSAYGCKPPESRPQLTSGDDAVFHSSSPSAEPCAADDVRWLNGTVVVGADDSSTEIDVEPTSPCSDCDATSIKSRLADAGREGGGAVGPNDAAASRAAAAATAADKLRRPHADADLRFCDDVVSRKYAGESASRRSASNLPPNAEAETEVQTSAAADTLTPRFGAEVEPCERNEARSSHVDVAPVVKTEVKSSVENERLLNQPSRRIDVAAVKPGICKDDDTSSSTERDGSSDIRTTECRKDQDLANDSECSPITKTGAFDVFVPKNFGRRRLSEEVDYDRHASSFVKRLLTFDVDHQMADVLSPPSDTRVPMDFITTSADGKNVTLSSVESDMPESIRLRLSTRAARHRAR